MRDGALGLTGGRLAGYCGCSPPGLALTAVLASMAGFVDFRQISSLAAESKEWPEDMVRFPIGGETPDQGALRHAFEKAGADIYEKMADNIAPSINAAADALAAAEGRRDRRIFPAPALEF
ncbi:MAG: hypothetical protein LBU32_08710 [Clostridiales bacterium]|nr:hypothetical protein [Clostridiales bacterium]